MSFLTPDLSEQNRIDGINAIYAKLETKIDGKDITYQQELTANAESLIARHYNPNRHTGTVSSEAVVQNAIERYIGVAETAWRSAIAQPPEVIVSQLQRFLLEATQATLASQTKNYRTSIGNDEDVSIPKAPPATQRQFEHSINQTIRNLNNKLPNDEALLSRYRDLPGLKGISRPTAKDVIQAQAEEYASEFYKGKPIPRQARKSFVRDIVESYVHKNDRPLQGLPENMVGALEPFVTSSVEWSLARESSLPDEKTVEHHLQNLTGMLKAFYSNTTGESYYDEMRAEIKKDLDFMRRTPGADDFPFPNLDTLSDNTFKRFIVETSKPGGRLHKLFFREGYFSGKDADKVYNELLKFRRTDVADQMKEIAEALALANKGNYPFKSTETRR